MNFESIKTNDLLEFQRKIVNSMVTSAGEHVDANSLSIIHVIGQSGVGKSWLINELAKSNFQGVNMPPWMSMAIKSDNFLLIDLDHFGSMKDDQWIVDHEFLSQFVLLSGVDFVIIAGISDNLEDVYSSLSAVGDYFSFGMTMEPESYRTTLRAKIDFFRSQDSPLSWVQNHEKTIKLSNGQIAKRFDEKFEKLQQFVPPFISIFVNELPDVKSVLAFNEGEEIKRHVERLCSFYDVVFAEAELDSETVWFANSFVDAPNVEKEVFVTRRIQIWLTPHGDDLKIGTAFVDYDEISDFDINELPQTVQEMLDNITLFEVVEPSTLVLDVVFPS